jgi:hypothetical protein
MIIYLTLYDAIRVTYCMEKSPSSEVKPFSISQETPQFMEREVNYRILNLPPPLHILRPIDTVHAPKSTS